MVQALFKPAQFNIKANILEIEGDYLVLSILLKHPSFQSKILSGIRILGHRKVFLNANMIFDDISIAIGAPIIAVFTEVTINTSGLAGAPHAQSQAKSGKDYRFSKGAGHKGDNGEEGLEGHDAGSIMIKALRFEGDVRLIKPIANGGKGGVGQDGGNG